MDGSIYGRLLSRPDDKSSSHVFDDVELTARLATIPDVLTDAWVVRHAAYASHGFIQPAKNGMFIDECDHYPSARTVVVYKNNSPVATVRVCLYAPESGIAGANRVPAMDVFETEIVDIFNHLRSGAASPRGVEVMRLSRHPSLGNDYEPVLALFRTVGYLLLHFDADVVVSGVRKHHMPFYRRLGFRKITEPRPYPKLKFETALMACVRRTGLALEDSMPVLGWLSKEDEHYRDFIAGKRVPILGVGGAVAGLGGIFAGRLSNPAAARALLGAGATEQVVPDQQRLAA